jgi:hypothetical protein
VPVQWGRFNLAFHAWNDPRERAVAAAQKAGVAIVVAANFPFSMKVVVMGVDTVLLSAGAIRKFDSTLARLFTRFQTFTGLLAPLCRIRTGCPATPSWMRPFRE